MTKNDAFTLILADINAMTAKAVAKDPDFSDGARTRLTFMVCAAHIVAAMGEKARPANSAQPYGDLLEGLFNRGR